MNYSTGYKTGQKKAPLQFHDDQELKPKWIYFVNRKYWLPTAHSVICIDLFEKKFIKRGKKCQLLCCGKYICTYNHNDSRSNPPILRTPIITRKSPRKRNIWVDELVLFQAADKIVDIDSISEQNSHENFTFVRLDNSGLYFNLICNEETGVLAVHECFSADRNLHVRFSYHGLVILLPQWFRYKNDYTFTKFSMLENFVPYLRNIKGDRSKWSF